MFLCFRWSPPLSSATCSEFCVSLHAYQVKVAARGGSPCAFQAGAELARHCLESPCSRAEIGSIVVNKHSVRSVPEAFGVREVAESRESPHPDPSKFAGYSLVEPLMRSDEDLGVGEIPQELEVWQDSLLDTSTQVQVGVDGEATATIEMSSAVDVWHVRIAFASAAAQSGVATSQLSSFAFSLSVVDDSGENIHTWETSVPPSPAAQSVWEAMDLRLYRAKTFTIKATQPFRIGEFQVFGMPLETCPTGGFLGPPSCTIPFVQRLNSHASLDCQGAWSEWTACQADCRRKRFMQVYQTEKEGGVPCQFFQHEPCAEGLCNSIFGTSFLRDEDCYPSPSRWSECIGCRQMRVWHILRAASAGGKACPSSIFETRSCVSGEGCKVSVVNFPVPPDQPSSEDDSTEENELMRPIGGIVLVAAVVFVLLLLAGLESWRRWGTSMSAYREVLNIQRQRDLIAARQQMLEYKQMIQDYNDRLGGEEQGSDIGEADDGGGHTGTFSTENSLVASVEEAEASAGSIHSDKDAESSKELSGENEQISDPGRAMEEESDLLEPRQTT